MMAATREGRESRIDAGLLKVAISGASGFVGKRLMAVLAESCDVVRAFATRACARCR